MQKKEPSSSDAFPRRDFLKRASAAAGAAMVVPSFVAGQSRSQRSPSDRINVAIVGVGGKGQGPTIDLVSENVVALCDVDMGRVAEGKEKNQNFANAIAHHEDKGAKWYPDYREMFTEMGDKIDAVVISTPDHMHYPIALSAINKGIHVYCEKPLTRTIGEARHLGEVARKKGVVTQMGNQGHSNAGVRTLYEWIDAGIIGKIKEVHSWTNRPIWPQGLPVPDHSKMIPVVPRDLDWDLWLGTAEPRAYDPAYLPFSWRGWWDFGSGAFGDMGCHILDGPFFSMKLDNLEWVEAASTRVSEEAAPNSSVVTMQFAANEKRGPIQLKWYDGGMLPPAPEFLSELPSLDWGGNSLYVGEDAAIITATYSQQIQVVPEKKWEKLREDLPERTLERIKGSHLNIWLEAIREGGKATSDFDYAVPLTQMVLAGNVALRAGKRVHFDPKTGELKPESRDAQRFIDEPRRDGWILS